MAALQPGSSWQTTAARLRLQGPSGIASNPLSKISWHVPPAKSTDAPASLQDAAKRDDGEYGARSLPQLTAWSAQARAPPFSSVFRVDSHDRTRRQDTN